MDFANILQKLEKRKSKKGVLNRIQTRTSRAKAQEEYTAAQKKVKKNIKKYKREYVDDIAKEAEEAAGKGDLKDLYMVTRKLSGNSSRLISR